MTLLPKPEVVRCYFDESSEPHLPAMELAWDADTPGLRDSVWRLPDNLNLRGGPPNRFGVTVERRGPNVYRLRVLWNQMSLDFERLTRQQILASSLSPLLAALGTDVVYLLDQPIAELTAA
jgi:hypothetical protein